MKPYMLVPLIQTDMLKSTRIYDKRPSFLLIYLFIFYLFIYLICQFIHHFDKSVITSYLVFQ